MKLPSRNRVLLIVFLFLANFLYMEREDIDALVIAPLQTSWALVERRADGFSVTVPASWIEVPVDLKKMDAQATQTAKTNPDLNAPFLEFL